MGLFDKEINGVKVLITSGGVRPTFEKAYDSDIWIDDDKVKINSTPYNITDGMTAIDVIEILDVRKQRIKKIKKLMK